MSTSLVIFLHGVGSRGADLAPLGDLWRTMIDGAVFTAPDAPFGFDQGGTGRQWFSVRGVTEENRQARIEAARADFDRVVGGLVEAHGFSERLERVALVGFSQGSIMALDALASGRWPVGAIVAFSGRLASPEPFTPSPVTRTLLVHGAADPVMPVDLAVDAEIRLGNVGVAVKRLTLPGVGHTISAEGAAAAAAFLKGVLAETQ